MPFLDAARSHEGARGSTGARRCARACVCSTGRRSSSALPGTSISTTVAGRLELSHRSPVPRPVTLAAQPFRGEVWDAALPVAGPHPIVVRDRQRTPAAAVGQDGRAGDRYSRPRVHHAPLGAEAPVTGRDEGYAVATELPDVPLRALVRPRGRLSRSELLALEQAVRVAHGLTEIPAVTDTSTPPTRDAGRGTRDAAVPGERTSATAGSSALVRAAGACGAFSTTPLRAVGTGSSMVRGGPAATRLQGSASIDPGPAIPAGASFGEVSGVDDGDQGRVESVPDRGRAHGADLRCVLLLRSGRVLPARGLPGQDAHAHDPHHGDDCSLFWPARSSSSAFCGSATSLPTACLGGYSSRVRSSAR